MGMNVSPHDRGCERGRDRERDREREAQRANIGWYGMWTQGIKSFIQTKPVIDSGELKTESHSIKLNVSGYESYAKS